MNALREPLRPAPSQVQPALAARSLAVTRGGRRVLDAVSLELGAGEWLAIVGPNGAGKSTLLSALAGLIEPDAGEVSLLGRPLAGWPHRERARRIAWLAQQGDVAGELAAVDIVRLGRLPHHGLLGAPGPADEAAVARALAATESAPFAARRIGALSGGERQRVLLARALAGEPQVLLLDEPATHLDAPHLRLLLATLARQAASGVAVAAVLHDITAALTADRVVVLDQGRLVAEGAPGDAGLHAALGRVFGGALEIRSVEAAEAAVEAAEPAEATGASRAGGTVAVATGSRRRWVAVPRL